MTTNNVGYSWGIGTSGALGDNTITGKSSPVAMVGAHSFTALAGGSYAGAGLKSDGSVWTWGAATRGGLGDNTTTSKSSPVAVVGAHSFTALVGGGVTNDSVVTDASTFLGLKADGSVWSWGYNRDGALGDNTTTDRSSPVTVVGAHSFVAIATSRAPDSRQASGALKSDGSAWTWGNNNSRQLGDGTSTARSSPVLVVGNHSFTQLAIGGDQSSSGMHMAGLKSNDGSVWTWGDNTVGQLGINAAASFRSSPVAVVGAHSFTAIKGGPGFTLGLKSNGSVWAWGSNVNGELGDNSLSNRSSPVAVVGAHSFTAIATGGALSATGGGFSLGLKANGQLWAWGTNAQGEIGDNTKTGRSSPVLVVGGFTFAAMDGGDEVAFALLSSAVVITVLSRRAFGPHTGRRQA